MKKHVLKLTLALFLISIILLVLTIHGEAIKFTPSDYDNPAIFEKGQEKAHAFHVPFKNTENAIINNINNCENFTLLNGIWKFKWVATPEEVPTNFEEPQYNTNDWDEINVPSNWQMKGFGHAMFRNVSMTFETEPPHPPQYYNPTGCYKRTFNVPSHWENKEILLRFEGIKSASYIWVNGTKVGYNQGGFEPAEFNITPFVKVGKNDISVQVMRYCDGSFLENQDMWRLSGIYRDVKLIALPKVHIQDFFYYTNLDEQYKNADLNVEINISNKSSMKAENYQLTIDVLDQQKQSILKEQLEKTVQVETETTQSFNFQQFVENPKKWSAEFPNLYSIVFELKDDKGNTVEAFTKKLGFKEVEMNKEVLLVNGVPVKLNGVNSHMHHPDYGQAVPLETLKQDLLIMKQFNINNVRTCHYPPTPEYLDMADEIGIYIVDEVGDEAHNNIELSNDESYTEMYKDRSRKLVYRDRNHASVIMWSAGNESGSGENISEVIKTGTTIDPTRPAWMYGGNTFQIPFEPVTGPRYWTPYKLKNLAERKMLGEEDLRPSYMDEYLAATGNGLGGLNEYWDLIWQYPRLSGGAIWDWISPGITTPLWTIPDQSSKNNVGALFGSPKFINRANGRALEFSGHDDWVEFYRDPSLDITGNQITISFWVKPSEIPQPNTFITKGRHGYGIIMNTPETLEFYVQSNNTSKLSHSPYFYYNYESQRNSVLAKVENDWYGNWHWVTGIYDGKKLQLYIDKKLVAEKAHTGNIAHTPFALAIGRETETQDQGEHEGRMSNMIIDDVKIFNSALSIDAIDKDSPQDHSVLSLNFEEDKKGANFYAIGLGGRTYGIVWPNREIQPEIHQIKKSGQPIAIEKVRQQSNKFKIINRHHFKNLEHLNLNWEILMDGKQVERGIQSVVLEAQNTTEIFIPFTRFKTDAEVILTVAFTLKEDHIWAKAGHEVAFEQFILHKGRMKKVSIVQSPIKLNEVDDELIISGKNFEYRMNKTDGSFSNLTYNNNTYIQAGPLFNIWRAPTSNDIDPWGAMAYSEAKKTPGLGRSIDNQLRTLGMRNFDVQIDHIQTEQINNKVVVSISKQNSSTNMRGAFTCNEQYTFQPNGQIDFEVIVTPQGEMPDMLPKLGYQLAIPKTHKNIEWYGRGKFETYPDRKTGAKVGIYKSNIDDEFVPYLIPQDYGNHTDVRWLKVENKSGKGFQIKSQELLNFSYHKYSTENLSRAMYSFQLKESDANFLNLDFEVSGVGGTAIRQLQKYRVKPQTKTYKISIQPY